MVPGTWIHGQQNYQRGNFSAKEDIQKILRGVYRSKAKR